MSVDWYNFEKDFLNANSWPQRKDGFPVDLLDALSPEERERAIVILKNKLDGRDDWPIQAMAHLHVSESLPTLRKLLQNVNEPATRAMIATAIYELAGDLTMEEEVAAVAASRKLLWVQRLDAIHCLGRFKTDSARQLLNELTNDPDYLVSSNAKLAGGKTN